MECPFSCEVADDSDVAGVVDNAKDAVIVDSVSRTVRMRALERMRLGDTAAAVTSTATAASASRSAASLNLVRTVVKVVSALDKGAWLRVSGGSDGEDSDEDNELEVVGDAWSEDEPCCACGDVGSTSWKTSSSPSSFS